MRKPAIFLLISLAIFVGPLYAQHEKFNAALKNLLADTENSSRFIEVRKGTKYISLFVELKNTSDFDTLREAGAIFRTITGTIATADVPLENLYKIASMDAVSRLELPLLFQRNNDTLMKKYTGVAKTHAGTSPLTKGLTGQGVVIGIIDDGIEFGHPEFLDAAGRTRIAALWSMDYAGNPPPGFNYGTVWEQDSLNYFLANNYQFTAPVILQRKFGSALHGTPVAGLASGKNGVAPAADVIAVSLIPFLDTLLKSDRIVDAIAFIYSRAKALEKKCVINISLGSIWGGPHDGNTLLERAIDEFCKDKPNLIVCTSAGNSGNDWKHWGGVPIRADSSFGIGQVTYGGSYYFSIPKQNSSTLRVSFTDGIRDANVQWGWGKDSVLSQTPYLRIDSIVQSPVPIVFYGRAHSTGSARISITGAESNTDYVEVIVTIDILGQTPSNATPHVNKFIFKGSGIVHGYFPFLNLHPLYVFGQGPYANNPSYLASDNHYSTVIPTHAKTVLSTGAYNVRDCYFNKLQDKVVTLYPSCQLTYFTSRGPTFDGRIKPDILNPGEAVLSSRSRWSTFMGHYFIVDPDYEMFGGTSASSPITAGMAALLFEAYPDFTRDSVISRLKSSAYSDAHTGAVFGAVPNNHAGWGKADIFRALTGVTTDYSSSCRTRIVCKVYTPPPPPPPAPAPVLKFVKVYPNPSRGKFEIQHASVFSFRLVIYDGLGQKLLQQEFPASGAILRKTLQLSHLPAGAYYYHFKGSDIDTSGILLIVR